MYKVICNRSVATAEPEVLERWLNNRYNVDRLKLIAIIGFLFIFEVIQIGK